MSRPPAKRKGVIVLDKALVTSAVWISLSGTAKAVYCLFRCRCRFEKAQGSRHRRQRPEHVNNGELVLTYTEALRNYAISRTRFVKALDELIENGFIDVAGTGMGLYRMATYYSISERWREYGTGKFIVRKRPKPGIKNPGFKCGNKLWQKAARKKVKC